MMDGLKDKHREAMIDILSANERVERVVLFGSRAMGTFSPTSDVDIVLYGAELTQTDRSKLAAAIVELPMPQQVDLLLHKSIKKRELLDHIKAHGVEWWSRSRAMGGDYYPNERLGNVAGIIMGQSPPGSTYNEQGKGLPFFQGVRDFNYRCPSVRVFCSAPSRIAQPGDILLSVRAPIGRVNIANRECCIGRGLSIVRAKSELDQRFIEFVLRLLEPSWQSIEGGGSVFGNATKKDLETLPVSWPKPHERQAISHILGSLDDKIELNRRMSKALEATARAIFKSWFVDFDPVRAKAEGRPTGLPDDIATLFPDSFEESELGEIPKGWVVKSLDQIAHYLNGLACQKYPPEEGKISLPVIKIRELRQGITENTDKATSDVPASYIVEDGDVLFSWSGSLLIDIWTQGKGVLNQHLFKITSKNYPKWFYYYWTDHHLKEFQRIASYKATTMGHIKRHHLADAKCFVPDDDIMKIADKQIAPLFMLRFQNELEVKKLASLRDTLLPKLISGELRVPDAEKFIEEAGL